MKWHLQRVLGCPVWGGRCGLLRVWLVFCQQCFLVREKMALREIKIWLPGGNVPGYDAQVTEREILGYLDHFNECPFLFCF